MTGGPVRIAWPYADPEPLEATEWTRAGDELVLATVRPAHVLIAPLTA